MTKKITTQHDANALLQRQVAQLEASHTAAKARYEAEIAALRGANRTLRDLSERMHVLYEVERELNRSETFDALCRSAIELGCSRLGFDRLGLWLFVKGTEMQQGTYGIDEQGRLRDERHICTPSRVKASFPSSLAATSPLLFMELTSLEEQPPGFMNPIAALWDGEKVIGFVSCDNLLSCEPITEPQLQLLTLYATRLGTLLSRWQALRQNVESERLFLAQIRSIYELERQLAHCDDFDKMCRLAVEEGRRRLGIERMGLWFHEHEDRFRGTYGTDEQGQTVDERHMSEVFSLKRFQSEFLDERQGVVVSQELWRGEAVEVASVALWQGEEIIGILFADNYSRRTPISNAQRELLLLYVGMLTDLCVRRRIQAELRASLEAERQTVEKMHTLYEVERELTHAESVDDLCRQAVELGKSRLGFERLGIWFFVPESDEITGAFGTDARGATQDERQLRFTYPVRERTQQFVDGHFAVVPDLEWIPEGAGDTFLRLNAALWNGKQVMGYLSCDNLLTLAPITPAQRRLLVLYASIIGYLCVRKQAELALQRYNEELETRVQERTMALEEANRRLEAELARRMQTEQALRNSEERNRLLIELSADAIVLIKNGHFVWVNPAGVTMLGCRHADELLGRSIFDFIPSDEREELRERAQTFYQEGVAYRDERICARADGALIYVDIVASPILHGEEQMALVILRDVTERRRMEQALRDSEERWQFALEGSGDGVWDANLVTQHSFYSRQWKAMLGYGEEEIGETFADWSSRVHPEDREQARAQLNAHVRGEIPVYVFEYRMRSKDGSYRWILARGKLMERDADGAPRRIVGTHTDITERKNAEAEIRRLHHDLQVRAAQLEAANQELESFCYSVSHDLRAPLRSIDGFSNALMEDYADSLAPLAVNYLQRVRTATQRMAQLIDDLLSLSRVTRSEIRRTRVDLTAMVRSVAAELTRAAPERKVEFVIMPGMEVAADASLMRIVLENLLGNAWKFTSKHTAAHIEIGSELREETLVFYVRDDGAGFDMAYTDKLFGAFQRLHGISEFEGTGIGLATVQRIIHRHGGRVWAEGAVEQGATFSFTL